MKAGERKSKRFHVIRHQSVNKVVHITMPKVSLRMYKQEFEGIGAAFGVSRWFKLTCQVACYKAVSGHMGQRAMFRA